MSPAGAGPPRSRASAPSPTSRSDTPPSPGLAAPPPTRPLPGGPARRRSARTPHERRLPPGHATSPAFPAHPRPSPRAGWSAAACGRRPGRARTTPPACSATTWHGCRARDRSACSQSAVLAPGCVPGASSPAPPRSAPSRRTRHRPPHPPAPTSVGSPASALSPCRPSAPASLA